MPLRSDDKSASDLRGDPFLNAEQTLNEKAARLRAAFLIRIVLWSNCGAPPAVPGEHRANASEQTGQTGTNDGPRNANGCISNSFVEYELE
jgi:hypothetical protein